jgi:DNA-binding LytR/AlgR family response regulator
MKYVKVFFHDIIFIRSRASYMQIVTEKKVYLVLNRIVILQRYLPKQLFCRIHRSYIVSLRRISSFDNHKVWLDPPDGKTFTPGLPCTKELNIGRAYPKKLHAAVSILPNFYGPTEQRLQKKFREQKVLELAGYEMMEMDD